MAKKKKTARNYLWVLVAMAVCAVLIPLFFLKDLSSLMTQTDTLDISLEPTRSTTYVYHSKFLKATINVPNDFSIKERFGEVTIKKEDKQIVFHWFGTNKVYNSLDEFLNDPLNDDTYKKSIERKKLKIDGYEAESVKVAYPANPENDYKAYYVYIDHSFYHMYTNSPELYNDLDKIAQSFRYTPEK